MPNAPKLWPPGPLNVDPIAIAAHAHIGDAEAGAVDGNEFIDLALQAVVKKILGAAQIAQAFLARVGDERNRAGRLHVGIVQRLNHAQHHSQAAAIVADAGTFQHRAIAL